MEATNKSIVWEFILNGFSAGPELKITVFSITIFLFQIMLAGNMCVIIIISANKCLHLPMYFFLVVLSLTETLTNVLVIPGVLNIIIKGQMSISRVVCFTQSYFYFFLTGTCFLYLGVMSYDRYVAICHPLRYSTIMRKELCIMLVVGCQLTMCFCLLYPSIKIVNLPYCSQILDHLFCDSAALMSLACTDVRFLKFYGIISSLILLLGPLTLTLFSYILIISTVIRIPSVTGRQKTFSTCLSHLTMVVIVFSSAIFLEIRPPSYKSVAANKVVSLGTTMLAPLANPFVYTLRNENVKAVIKNMLKQKKNIVIKDK
ncbi:hypothetical protein GDO78_015558 [Eleutherodactylus coqui]|uniref:Olfactory receptor n=1 Tax=Eleutherodactylus coqui TaxID=57060 RepID=A0A8J6B0R6_ELECQ|nr:hypothetical protein GDO78_015558 [Eleutherodactylus coqui]